MASDWIRLHRQSIDSRCFGDPFIWHLWCWCLLKTNWKSSWKDGREIKPGQFTCGRNQSADQLNCSGSKWYRGMQQLQEWGQITVETNSKWTTVTICNWTTYQERGDPDRTASEQPVNSERTASEQPVDTLKEGKNLKEGKKDPPTPLAKPPPELDTPEFGDAWVEWERHRREKGKNLTPTAVTRQMKRLAEMGVSRAIAAIHFSIAQEYTGIWEKDSRDKQPTFQDLTSM